MLGLLGSIGTMLSPVLVLFLSPSGVKPLLNESGAVLLNESSAPLLNESSS